MRSIPPILYLWLKVLKKGKDLRQNLIEWMFQLRFFAGKGWIEVYQDSQTTLSSEKHNNIGNIKPQQKVIYFTFREFHFLDWFVPIHLALNDRFPGKYAVFYIDFGSTLRNVGNRSAYREFHLNILKRLQNSGIARSFHFSDREISYYKAFPSPDLIVTTETIRKEVFIARHRVYLPHYCVLKAKDTLPEKIKYNHVFLPSRPPFSYPEIENTKIADITFHKVGYPKIHLKTTAIKPGFDHEQKLVIYAPSLDPKLILPSLKEGIFDIFKRMTDINFVIKLHPTLSSKMQNVRRLIKRQVSKTRNIIIDSQTSIQEIGDGASVLLTDFGSVGAEFRLRFSKRVVYLKVPKSYEGGGDLLFRDRFADEITDIDALEVSLRSALDKGDLAEKEIAEMKNQVLYQAANADQQAAEAIDKILTES